MAHIYYTSITDRDDMKTRQNRKQDHLYMLYKVEKCLDFKQMNEHQTKCETKISQ